MTKILLVEDDKSLREIYGVRLLAEGYDIVSAGDGEEALAMAIKERPDLIVSDVMMPKISGFDMLDILRSTTETKDIKVIMMTALSSEDQRLRGEKLGADRYLVKSQVGIEDVVRTVHEVLGDMMSVVPQQAAAPITTPTIPAVPAAQPTVQQPAPQPMPQPQMAPAAPHAPAAPAMPMAAPTPAMQQPAPVAAPQSFAQPQPTMPTPQQPAPTAPSPSPSGNALPQPTAPFSSPAPRPSNLGDRVIQPITAPESLAADLSSMIDNELSSDQPLGSVPQATPMTQPTPAQPQPISSESANRPDIASLSPQPTATPQHMAQPTAMPQQPEQVTPTQQTPPQAPLQ